MDMFIRTNRYFDKEKYELNESDLIFFIRISIHTILSLNVYSGISTRVEKVQSLPRNIQFSFYLRKIKVCELHRKNPQVHVRKNFADACDDPIIGGIEL